MPKPHFPIHHLRITKNHPTVKYHIIGAYLIHRTVHTEIVLVQLWYSCPTRPAYYPPSYRFLRRVADLLTPKLNNWAE